MQFFPFQTYKISIQLFETDKYTYKFKTFTISVEKASIGQTLIASLNK